MPQDINGSYQGGLLNETWTFIDWSSVLAQDILLHRYQLLNHHWPRKHHPKAQAYPSSFKRYSLGRHCLGVQLLAAPRTCRALPGLQACDVMHRSGPRADGRGGAATVAAGPRQALLRRRLDGSKAAGEARRPFPESCTIVACIHAAPAAHPPPSSPPLIVVRCHASVPYRWVAPVPNLGFLRKLSCPTSGLFSVAQRAVLVAAR